MAHLLLLQGRAEAARAILADIARSTDPATRRVGLFHTVVADLDASRLEAALETADALVALDTQLGDPFQLGNAHEVRGLVLRQMGRRVAAIEAFAQAAQILETSDLPDGAKRRQARRTARETAITTALTGDADAAQRAESLR